LMVRTTPGTDTLSMLRREISAIDERIVPVQARSMRTCLVCLLPGSTV